MNRRRFLGLSILAPLAALGTRVPEPAQAVELKADPDMVVRPTAPAQTPNLGYWAYPDGSIVPVSGVTVASASWAEPKPYVYTVENGLGFYSSDPANQRTVTGFSAWDFDDMMAAQAASRPGVLYERFTCANPENGRAEIERMARRDRERADD